MNFRISLSLAILALVVEVCHADDPFVASFEASQNTATCQVSVRYSLSSPAVVTLNVETNVGDGVWLPFGAIPATETEGDINRLVSDSDIHTIVWNPGVNRPWRPIRNGRIRVGIRAWSPTEPPDYMVVDLTRDNVVRYYESEDAVPFNGGVTNVLCKTDYLVMRKIHAAGKEFLMGPITNETGSFEGGAIKAREYPQHPVAFTSDYYIAIFELTQRQYLNIMRKSASPTNPSAYSGDDRDVHPLESCTAGSFRGWVRWPENGLSVGAGSAVWHLRANTGVDTFDAPTEARWEFAYRAGTCTELYTGKNVTTSANLECPNASETAWYWHTSGDGLPTHEVGTRGCNPWGLYDMGGNVQELCKDRYSTGVAFSDGSYVVDPPGPRADDPAGGVDANSMTRRGGSITQQARDCRAAARISWNLTESFSNSGFRMCCEAVAK